MSEALETYEISENLELRILHNDMAESPRTAWDNTAKMVCFHKRYNLGDKHDYHPEDFDGWDALREQIEQDYSVLAIKPLYLYDHSGITINTGGFSCRWDSGQIGWIFIHNDAEESLAELFEDRLNAIIDSEVKIYDEYLRGNVFGFQLVEKSICESCGTTEEEIIDSCWGFYGDDIKENGILDCLSVEHRDAVLKQV